MSEWIEWPSATRLRSWQDAEGHWWHRIGNDLLDRKVVRRMIFDDSVQVVLFYGPEPTPVIGEQSRRELWSRVEPVLRGRADKSSSNFKAVRFRDGQGRSMLAIEEHC